MARRLHQTMADYVVIAISPALVMTLVGSLVFFLLTVFYQGEYPERLSWVMACFVFAAVLIGRISIEEGFERAAPFGIALAIVVAMATNSFLQFHGRSIESFSWIVNWGLIGLVWWCAHRLTWDCTMIDDEQDASGEGLLEIAGLERRSDSQRPAAEGLEGTTSRQVPAGWWQRYVQHQHRPHAPGVWVVYFSLAALPLFGIGGWFIPAGAAGPRRLAFWLLCLYVASGMGLLLTTSFLGLRRYLRQRRIEMPTKMANLWLGMGAAVILLLLVFAALLPRPSAEYAISQLPISLGSPDAKSSSHAPLPQEGAHDEQPGSAPARQPAENSQDHDQQQPGDANADQPPDASGNSAPADGKRPDGQATEPGSQGGSSSDGKSQGGQSSKSGRSGGNSDKGSRSGKQSRSQANQTQPNQTQPNQTQPNETQPNESNEAAQSADSQVANRPPEEQPAGTPKPGEPPGASSDVQVPPAQAPLGILADILKWAFYVALAGAVLYFLWQFRGEVLRSIRDFLSGLREFWDRLWGRRRPRGLADDEPVEIRIPPAPFSTYADPFATGIDGRYSVEELVRYSFEAFEAWSREHGCQRQPDQTPHELARDVARRSAPMAAGARNIAELYARAAYARGELPDAARGQLRQLWQSMRATAGEPR